MLIINNFSYQKKKEEMSSEVTRMSTGSGQNNGFSNNINTAGIADDPSSTNDVKPVSIFSTDYKKYNLSFKIFE